MSSPAPQDPVGAGEEFSRRPLKVAILTPAWPGGQIANGIVTYAAHIVPALRERGTEVFVVTAIDGSGVSDPYLSIPAPVRETLAARILAPIQNFISPGAPSVRHNAIAIVREVQRLEREHGIDLVEMEESFGWCGWVADQCTVPIVVRLHGPWFLNGAMVEDTTTRSFHRRVRSEGEAITRVAAISSPSRSVLDLTRAHYGLALPDAEVISHPMPECSSEDRWSVDKRDPRTVLFVGRFDRHKGGDVVIEAFALIRKADPTARMIFVGPDLGYTDDNGRVWHLPEFLESRVPNADDRAAFEWLGERQSTEIRELRARAAVTIVSSRYETFGYTLVEAMSQGCPVVSSAAGGLAELIEDGVTGLSVPPADPAALARAVVRLLRDGALAARLGENAAKSTSVQLSPRTIGDQTLAFYRRVLDRRKVAH